ncbi:MAG: hypothetical protein K1X74_20485 [Pirellulales bacterium]|nr:hypothetical protein [Pirellulales bacterium]
MPHPARHLIGLGLVMITVGTGWLLNALGLGPEINWVWTLALAAIGVLSLAQGGRIDKFNVIVGPWFLIASALSVLRQAGLLVLDVEVPLLVIAGGALLVIAQSPRVPIPHWLQPDAAATRQE